MKVDILASGSNGNCIALSSGESIILVDAGIAKTKIEKRLLEVGITPNNVQAIFITHAHKDHTKGLPLANKYHIPVFAGADEWKDIHGVDEELRKTPPAILNDGTEYTFEVKCFNTHHDAYEPLGYVVKDLYLGLKCSICLDTGKVDQDMLQAMKDSDIYIIESNHVENMVAASDYPNSVKARILSDIGHLSNQQTANALSKLVQGKGEQIYLTHLSSSNNLPFLAKGITENALLKRGFIRDKHYKLEVIE
ncbi:MBL fold metallo-hydrolase [Oceanobacillus sp. J11TS1]|uniref:MBL fold metallo-hydrolase n=1 Tax=Oceanobacillus sp. J11TS1 TaxID=2807191 RepID=UPI001B122A75|nr:MBL fold metallo-hydrolase [Oceanobacillus sp. J11TS1]GIO22454.1 putative metallo-hydrolase YycJ [Oceanobacillus sp. J11TS1]